MGPLCPGFHSARPPRPQTCHVLAASHPFRRRFVKAGNPGLSQMVFLDGSLRAFLVGVCWKYCYRGRLSAVSPPLPIFACWLHFWGDLLSLFF